MHISVALLYCQPSHDADLCLHASAGTIPSPRFPSWLPVTVSKTLLSVAVFQPEIIPRQKNPQIPPPEGHLDLRQPPCRWRALRQPSVRLIYQSHYAFPICSQIHLLDLGLVLWKEENSAAGV